MFVCYVDTSRYVVAVAPSVHADDPADSSYCPLWNKASPVGKCSLHIGMLPLWGVLLLYNVVFEVVVEVARRCNQVLFSYGKF